MTDQTDADQPAPEGASAAPVPEVPATPPAEEGAETSADGGASPEVAEGSTSTEQPPESDPIDDGAPRISPVQPNHPAVQAIPSDAHDGNLPPVNAGVTLPAPLPEELQPLDPPAELSPEEVAAPHAHADDAEDIRPEHAELVDDFVRHVEAAHDAAAAAGVTGHNVAVLSRAIGEGFVRIFGYRAQAQMREADGEPEKEGEGDKE
jgi:hypothetical protein